MTGDPAGGTAGTARPLPSSRRVDALDEPFWAGCARGDFLLHQCGTCLRHYWPASACVDHGPAPMRWVPATGRGVLHAYVEVVRTSDPAFSARVPYNVVVVRLDEQVLFHASVPNPPTGGLAIGQRVEVVFEPVDAAEALPVFRVVPGRPGSQGAPPTTAGGNAHGQH